MYMCFIPFTYPAFKKINSTSIIFKRQYPNEPKLKQTVDVFSLKFLFIFEDDIQLPKSFFLF